VAAARFDPPPEFRIMPERAIVSPKFGATTPAVNAPIRKQGRIVGVFQIELGDATGWCKELKALPILNVPVTLGRLFHKVFNRAVEKKGRSPDNCQPLANGLPILQVFAELLSLLLAINQGPGTITLFVVR
jgi:hypothetical protein